MANPPDFQNLGGFFLTSDILNSSIRKKEYYLEKERFRNGGRLSFEAVASSVPVDSPELSRMIAGHSC